MTSVPPRRALALTGSLTARLVAILVILIIALASLIAVATTLVMRDYLTDRLDATVTESLRRAVRPAPPLPGQPDQLDQLDQPGQLPGADRLAPRGLGNQTPGTIVVQADAGRGVLLTDQLARPEELSRTDVQSLSDLEPSVDPQSVDVPGLGRYRVASADTRDGSIWLGLPEASVQEAVGSLVRLELGLGIGGALVVGAAGLFLVKRELRPLREVADTATRVADVPMETGAVDLPDRVPTHLSSPDGEVGRVGAALNGLLNHVESSLNSRHRSEQLLRQFVADASHELRTPLATISGYAELARTHPEDSGAALTALSKVEEESDRMTSLVEDLLLLARLDAGQEQPREPVDVTRLLVEAIADARVLSPEHHWDLRAPGEPVTVEANERGMYRVVTNLITNARKHTPPGTTVRIEALRDGFRVTDDGPGIDPDLEVFERFTRADGARHREGGSGLGLALVHAIVTDWGGRVDLVSEPGDTTFEVHVPPASAEQDDAHT